MTISGNQFVSNALKNLSIPMKKNEPVNTESQRQLQEIRRMVAEEEQYQKALKAESIAKKIARGEYVTAAEKEQVKGIDAEMLMEAEQANNYRKQINVRLANAKTPGEASAILLEGKETAGKFIRKDKEQLGLFLMEAVNQSESDYNKGRRQDSSTPVDLTGSKVSLHQGQSIDIRL